MIEKADYQKLMEIEAERKALIEKMMPHAKAVADAYYRQSVEGISFGPVKVFVAVDQDMAGSFPCELLFDPDWKAKIAQIYEKERERCDRLMAKLDMEHKKREESKDLAELKRLQAKYPDAIENGRHS